MLTNLEIFIVTGLTILGALFSASLGWLDSGEPFVGRKFTASILRAILSAIFVASTTFVVLNSLNGWDYIAAFLAGVAGDILGHRISGAIATRAAEKAIESAKPVAPSPVD